MTWSSFVTHCATGRWTSEGGQGTRSFPQTLIQGVLPTPYSTSKAGDSQSYLRTLSPPQLPEGMAQEGQNEHASCLQKASLFA